MTTARSPRLLGVAVPDVRDWRGPTPSGKWSQFFSALDERFSLIDVVRPELSRRERAAILARSFHPRRRVWQARAGFSPELLRDRSEAVQRGLDEHRGGYELIVQLQTLCRPGGGEGNPPHIIYTDSTMALTRRHYPAGAPISAPAATAWMRFEAETCRSAAAVFTFSQFTRRSMIDDYGCAPGDVHAVGAGANHMRRAPDTSARVVPRALFVGADFTRKGGEVLLAAWRRVRQLLPQAELVIAGPRRRPPHAAATAGIRWVGRVSREQLEDLYASASVFVLPSLFEPWGFVFFEAMGYGLPCVASRCCAMPEMIKDGVSGRLVVPGDPESLAEALLELLSNPARASEMGRAAHAYVLGANRWSDVVARIASRLPAP